MRVLILGGTGTISTAVVQRAFDEGHEVWVLNRGRSTPFYEAEAKHLVADRHDHKAFYDVLKGLEFDVVADFIAYVPDDVKQDIEVFHGRCGQFVFISSASAYQKPPAHYVITEETPLSNPYWEYSRNKIACEEMLTAAYGEKGFPSVIVRPSHTYSPRKIPGSFLKGYTLFDRILKDRPVITPDGGQTLWTMTWNEDFAAAFVGLFGNEQAIGEAFHITSDEALTWDQLHHEVGQALGHEVRIVHIPTEAMEKLHPPTYPGWKGDKSCSMVFDNNKIKRFVPGFEAKVCFHEGMCRCRDWLEKHPELKVVDEEMNRQADHIIDAYVRVLDSLG